MADPNNQNEIKGGRGIINRDGKIYFYGYTDEQKAALEARRVAADTIQKKLYEDKVDELKTKIASEEDEKLKKLYDIQKTHLEEAVKEL